MAASFPYLFSVNLGISQSGSPGSYSYAVMGNGNMPVFDVTWGDAARFCNWLQNGQPERPEGNGTTETGAYTLNGGTSQAFLGAVARNPGATYFIPSENEWYKAAYYKGGGTDAGYWLYPTQSSTTPSNLLSATGTNNANYYNDGYTDPTNILTPVGEFADSPGPYGTYDMGGDVFQWTEAEMSGVPPAPYRGICGGCCNYDSAYLASSQIDYGANPTDVAAFSGGFRVASSTPTPEPGSIALLLAGAVALGLWRFLAARRVAMP